MCSTHLTTHLTGRHSLRSEFIFLIDSLLILNFLSFNTKLPVFISVFPLCFEKKAYLCHTLSAHRRDETVESGYYFKWNMTYYLSYPKSSSFYSRRDDTTDIPRERLVSTYPLGDVLYINDWRGCLLLSLSREKVR